MIGMTNSQPQDRSPVYGNDRRRRRAAAQNHIARMREVQAGRRAVRQSRHGRSKGGRRP